MPRRYMQTLLTVVAVLLSFAAIAFAQELDSKLRDELIAMRDRDQKAREDCSKGPADAQMPCYVAITDAVDKPNTARLEEIVKTLGVPDAKMVGEDGVRAYYLVLQHSPSIELKKKSRKSMKKAFEAKVVSAMDYANFTDRLLVNLGKPQVYGSNFDVKDGKLVMSRTKDVRNLDARRRKLGLPPIAEYARVLEEMYRMEVVVEH